MSQDTGIDSLYDKKGQGEESVEIIDTIEDSNKLNPQERMEEKNVRTDLQRALSRLSGTRKSLNGSLLSGKHDDERNRRNSWNVRITCLPASRSRYYEA